jgi:hypothetical protein
MLSKSSADFPLNTAVVDWRTLRSAGRAFTSTISLDDLLCFFSLTEGLVLYDTIYVSPKDAPLPDPFEPLRTKGIITISDAPTFRKDDTPLNRKPGGLMEQSNASLQRGDQG